jgi:hypothetical protein
MPILLRQAVIESQEPVIVFACDEWSKEQVSSFPRTVQHALRGGTCTSCHSHACILESDCDALCPPPRKFGAQVAPVAQAVMQAKGIKLALMSTERCPSITAQLKIDSVPCLMTFVGGKVVDKSPGGMPSLDLASQYVAKMVDLGATTAATNTMIQAGQLLAEGKVEEALQQYMAVLQMSKVKHGAVAHVR